MYSRLKRKSRKQNRPFTFLTFSLMIIGMARNCRNFCNPLPLRVFSNLLFQLYQFVLISGVLLRHQYGHREKLLAKQSNCRIRLSLDLWCENKRDNGRFGSTPSLVSKISIRNFSIQPLPRGILPKCNCIHYHSNSMVNQFMYMVVYDNDGRPSTYPPNDFCIEGCIF